MLAHYSHVRLERKSHALDGISAKRGKALEFGQREGSYGTNNGTNCGAETETGSETIENMVSAAGFEPATHALKGLLEAMVWVRQDKQAVANA